jgi:hypothetical protein
LRHNSSVRCNQRSPHRHLAPLSSGTGFGKGDIHVRTKRHLPSLPQNGSFRNRAE